LAGLTEISPMWIRAEMKIMRSRVIMGDLAPLSDDEICAHDTARDAHCLLPQPAAIETSRITTLYRRFHSAEVFSCF
jgi:hypothetical protein